MGFNNASIKSTREVGSMTGLVAKRHGVMILSTVSNAAGSLIRVSSCLCGGGPSKTGRIVGGLTRGCCNRVRRLCDASRCGRGTGRLVGRRFSRVHAFAGSLFALFRRGIILTRNRLVSANVVGLCLGRYNVGSILVPTLSCVHASGGTRPSPICVGRGLVGLLSKRGSTSLFVARNCVYQGTCNRVSGLRHNNDSCDTSLVNTTVNTRRVRV